MNYYHFGLFILLIFSATSCNEGGNGDSPPEFPVIDGVLRTPDARFEKLPGYDFEANYVEFGNIRMHYVDEGPKYGVRVVMLHGEPTWSYMYRNIVPIVVAAEHRAIVPDLINRSIPG